MCQASSHFFSAFKAASNSVNSSPHFAIKETKFWRLSKFHTYPAASKKWSHVSLASKSIILVQEREKLSKYTTLKHVIYFALLKICFEHFELNFFNHRMVCTLHIPPCWFLVCRAKMNCLKFFFNLLLQSDSETTVQELQSYPRTASYIVDRCYSLTNLQI